MLVALADNLLSGTVEFESVHARVYVGCTFGLTLTNNKRYQLFNYTITELQCIRYQHSSTWDQCCNLPYDSSTRDPHSYGVDVLQITVFMELAFAA